MADKIEEPESVKQERKIPVFTVLKNNSILKNIFLLDNPPSISDLNSIESVQNVESNQEFEEILVVGRHPDCNITLEHPSISRYHLQILSKPSSQMLSVIDLSSVHGTWVSGNKIKPGVPVELNDGDNVRLGGSSRVYRLHWVPLSRAYDLDDPFVPPLDGLLTVKEAEEETYQDEINQSQSLYDELEGLDLLFSNENLMSSLKKVNPSAPPMPEYQNSSFYDEEEEANKSEDEYNIDKQNHMPEPFPAAGLLATKNSEDTPGKSELKPNLPGNLNSSLFDENGCQVTEVFEVAESQSSVRKDSEQKRILTENGSEQFNKENSTPEASVTGSKLEDSESPLIRSNFTSIWARRGKPASVQVQTSKTRGKSTRINIDAEVEPLNQENMENESISKALFASVDRDEEIFTPDKENSTPNTLLLRFMKNTSKAEEIKHLKSYRLSPRKIVSSVDPNIHQLEDMLSCSDKENQTPKVLQEQKSVRPALRKEARLEPGLTEAMSRADRRVPFQTLLVNSMGKSMSKALVLEAPTRSSNSANCTQTIEKVTFPSWNDTVGGKDKRWIMVVDINCLLNTETRKALQLLQGLKGTQLIIPRIVIRELDCMRRRGSLFRRTTEISSALQWIEDCMANTKWWIHVQSSVEEGRPIAPTPPASPLSQFKENSSGGFPFGSVPFSACQSLLEIVSPTAEDYILECALLYRRIKNDGHLVLLSDDIALKIKAMAEGLICETAEEFRESLVNPFSDRFLWADSSPRGPTWSCVDDVVLREKYYCCPVRKPSKSGEGLKGLKLILLHNSHFREINSVC